MWTLGSGAWTPGERGVERTPGERGVERTPGERTPGERTPGERGVETWGVGHRGVWMQERVRALPQHTPRGPGRSLAELKLE